MGFRTIALVAVLIALGLWTLAIAGAIELDSSFIESRAAARLLGLAGLLSVPLVIAAIWSWRRGRYIATLSPEYRRGLMKVRRGNEWFAEAGDGRWMKWDPLSADWQETTPPEDPALIARPKLSAPPPPPSETTAPEADLLLWQARREAEARRAKLGKIGIAARVGGGVSLVVVGLLLVLLVVAGIAAVGRFFQDLPW